MFANLLRGTLTAMAAPDGAVTNGSTEGGAPAAANAEDQLSGAFGANAGADGKKNPGQTQSGDAAKGETGTGSEVKLAPWTEQLPPEMRGDAGIAAKLARFGKPGDMVKEFLELESKAASGGIPGKDAAPEEAASFWEKAGKPKTADGYSFSKDKEGRGGEFARASFNANLTAAQADAMFKSLNDLGMERALADDTARKQRLEETANALQAEYGSKYPEKMELLSRGLRAAGPNVGSLLSQAGLAGNPEIVKAFIAFGEMTAESGSSRGGAAENPLKSIEEGGSFEFKT